MKIFQCDNCSHVLFFENASCENCGHLVGYIDGERRMLTFDPAADVMRSELEGRTFKYCRNHAHAACNWLLDVVDGKDLCHACEHNRTIPNLAPEGNLEKWRALEVAKHRLIYQLQRLGLSAPTKDEDARGLCFDFVERRGDAKLMTGHADGVVTILLSEADAAHREQTRQAMGEPYRTLIGHLRHEVGHYFWNVLVQPDARALAKCRELFGDERRDYGEALKTYYKAGPPRDWQSAHISAYATSHPWEDWAETWAHYLHLMDMVETAYAFRVTVSPLMAPYVAVEAMQAAVTVDPYTVTDMAEVIDVGVPVSYAVNSVNRAMGLSDVYPFVISQPVREKLAFIHGLMLRLRT